MPNALLYLTQTLVTLLLVLVCFRLGRAWLTGYVAMAAVLMNLLVMKQMRLFGLDATGGNVLYASIFLATDLLAEHWGTRDARRAVRIGFLGGLLFLVSTQFILRYAPLPVDPAVPGSGDFAQPHMEALFGFLPRIVLGSLTAYLLSQHLDVWLFERIRQRTGGRHLWLRNNGSTWISQAVDTVVFYGIAFYGIFPIAAPILFTWLLKIVVAAIDTPFIYLSHRLVPAREGSGSD